MIFTNPPPKFIIDGQVICYMDSLPDGWKWVVGKSDPVPTPEADPNIKLITHKDYCTLCGNLWIHHKQGNFPPDCPHWDL